MTLPKVYLLAMLAASLACYGSDSLKVVETEDTISLARDGQTILTYNKARQQPPEGIDPLYARSGYLHPVFAPSGQILTGDFSVDHPHQRGIFMAGVNTEFKGESVDFWNLHKSLGRVEHNESISSHHTSNSAAFTVSLSHIATTGAIEETVLEETWTVTAHQSPGEFHVFDIESAQRLASDAPLYFKEYHYGGMALRGNNDWTPIPSNPEGTCEFLTSDGLDREAGNHTHARWVAMYGVVENEEVSIVVLCHPSNFRAPQTVRIHPKMPYFTFAPMYDGEFSIQPGENYSSRYRYLVTAAKPDRKWIEAQWRDYTK